MLRRAFQFVRGWLAGDEMRRDQEPEQPDPGPATQSASGVDTEEPPTEVASATPDSAGRRHLVKQARAKGIDDTIRHEEDMLDMEILPIVAQLEASRRSRLDELRIEWGVLRQRYTDELGRATRALEHAEEAFRAIEASLYREGVPVEELALPSRRGLPVLLQHVLIALGTGALFAVGAHLLGLRTDDVAAVGFTAVAFVALLALTLDGGEPNRIAVLRRRRSRAERALHHARDNYDALVAALDELPERVRARAQVELDLPAEQLAAYESGVLSALPPGALGADRRLRPQRLSAIAMPDWVPQEPGPAAQPPPASRVEATA